MSKTEKACSKLDNLDSVIAALEKAHGEYCAAVRRGDLEVGSPCSFKIAGFEASYLLKSLKAVRNTDADPFGIDAALRQNRAPSIQEKARLAHEVKVEIEAVKNRDKALLIVGARYKMNGNSDAELSSKLAKIYDEMKGFV